MKQKGIRITKYLTLLLIVLCMLVAWKTKALAEIRPSITIDEKILANTYTEASGNGWYYDGKGTITLNSYGKLGSSGDGILASHMDLKIVVKGYNDVNTDWNASEVYGACIYMYDGNLTITGDSYNSLYLLGSSYGVIVDGGNLTIENINVTSDARQAFHATGDITFDGAIVKAYGKASHKTALTDDIFGAYTDGTFYVKNHSVFNAISDQYGIKANTTIVGSDVDSFSAQGEVKAIDGKVVNRLTGTGFHTYDISNNAFSILPSENGRDLSAYKLLMFPQSAPVISENPEVIQGLVYTGKPIELVTPGKAIGGTMMYAVSTNKNAPPGDSAYSTSIPSATEPGEYYVYYKAVASGNNGFTGQSTGGYVTPFISDLLTVIFDPNNGTTGNEKKSFIHLNKYLTLPECTFTAPEGQEFDKWDLGFPGENVQITGYTVIKALWKDKTTTPDPTPTPTPDPMPSPDPTPTPDPTPSPDPTPTPTPDPTPSPDPTPTPDPTPSPEPTNTPAPKPTSDPTPAPNPTPDTTPAPENQTPETVQPTQATTEVQQAQVSSEADKKAETVDKKQKSTSISKVKADKKSITVTWKKQTAKGIKGYELQYSTDKSFKKDVKTVSINKTKTTSKTIKKLKAGKKYYVRIRTFKKSGSEKVYSSWSKKKSVKVK